MQLVSCIGQEGAASKEGGYWSIHLKLNNVYNLLVLSEAIGAFLDMEFPHVWFTVVVVVILVVVVAVVVVEVVVSTKTTVTNVYYR